MNWIELVEIRWNSSGQISKGGDSCFVVMCPFRRSWCRGLWDREDQRKEQRTRFDRSKRVLGALGKWILGWATKGGERFFYNRDPSERRQGGSELRSEAA